MTLPLPIQPTRALARGTFAAGALAAAIALSPAPAQAGSYNGGDVLAAGVLGAFVGALVAPPVYRAPVYGAPVYGGPVYGGPVYVAPPPPDVVYVEPPVVYDAPVYRRHPAYDPAPVYRNHEYRQGGDKYPGVGWEAQPPAHKKYPPKVVTYDETVGGQYAGGAMEPWSKGWFDWCRANFRSFDGRTGTYKGYDGQRHFCEVN